MTLREHLRENVGIALGAMRASKLRSALTILGVVIGVATVMAMAAIVQGIRAQIVHTIEIAGPTTFYVAKTATPVNPNRLPEAIKNRPDLKPEEAARIELLPEIDYAALWGQTLGKVEYRASRTQQVAIFGADSRFTDIQGGDLASGRWFTRGELASGAGVAVIDRDVAARIFGREDPLGKIVRVGGRAARVIGVYEPPANIFSPPGQSTGAIIPYAMLDHQFTFDRTNGLFIVVKPRPGVTVARAQEAAMVVLRRMRHLRPSEPNSFDLLTQDQILDTFNKITGAFFLVMIVLSAVALLVGGIGVMAIMMVSVTDRTREIGVRKALGATRRDILLQFLIEAATLTGIGGLIGLVIGLGLGRLVTALMKIDATTPFTYTVVAVTVSVSIGLVFGLLPANRAARLDPIEALRYE
ncbi:MAG TPA: ABC transporter permease [Gemmatimonadaceae bacterium]|nr:ABC transporter permease [Gemmatimonadaceae bacterium]